MFRLWGCSLDDESAGILARALAENATLRKLDISHNRAITITGWRAIFDQLVSPHSPLEHLDLAQNWIDDDVANLLANALANGASLKVLSFSEIDDITPAGWRAVFAALQSPHCLLQGFHLDYNFIHDEDVTYLANCLANSNSALRHLDLNYCPEVTSSGWRVFAAVLQNPNSALERVYLHLNIIDEDVMVSLANSLTHNNVLKELFLDYDETKITVGDTLSNVLCNKSSINATLNSNHTLGRIINPDDDDIDESELPSDLRFLLQLNRENTKAEAARRKILKVHFCGDFNMQPFIDMNLKVLPYAIAWMARDEYGSSLLYQFVRNTSLFHDIDGAF